MKRKRKSNPQLPTGRMIHCEGVVLDSKGRVKKMKIRQNEMKKLKGVKNPPKRKRKTAKRKPAKRRR